MGKPAKIYGGRYIGAAALTMLFWAAPHDYRQSLRVEWTRLSSLRIGLFMAGVQWLNAILLGRHDNLWILRTLFMSGMFVGLLVFTRLIAEEVEQLEAPQRGTGTGGADDARRD